MIISLLLLLRNLIGEWHCGGQAVISSKYNNKGDNLLPNPLDFITHSDIAELGLSQADIEQAYQPSSGGVYHARGAEGTGKTLLIAHLYRALIDSGEFTPYDAIGNLTFKGKYGKGFTTLKGAELFSYLLEFSRNLPRHKIIIVSEIDREFPARFFASKEQTEIALSMWEIQKIDSYFLIDSHIGNSTDLIFHLGSHFMLYPNGVNWQNKTLNFDMVNNLKNRVFKDELFATDIVRTMLIYNRCETTVIGNHSSKKSKLADVIPAELADFLDEDSEIIRGL